MAKGKKQKKVSLTQEEKLENQVRKIILEQDEIHNFIRKGIVTGIDAIVKTNADSCRIEQKQCSIEIVNAAYEYKKTCNEEITEKITQIIRYYKQNSDYTSQLEKYTKSKTSSLLAIAQIQAIEAHRRTDRNKTQADMKSKLSQIVKKFFIATSIFEHRVNVFIGQFPIQVFVLTDQTGEEICFFSYDGSNYEVLKTIVSEADMSLKSGTAISFNMTMDKAQRIIGNLVNKQQAKTIKQGIINKQSFDDTGTWSLFGSADPATIINDNLANLISISTHQNNLSNIIASNQGAVTEAKKLQEFYQTLNDTLVVPSKNPNVRTTRRRVVGLKNASTHFKMIKPPAAPPGHPSYIAFDSAWTIKKQGMTFKNRKQEQKQKELFYRENISKEHFNQYFDLNGGQLKEGFFGHYFQLEHNEWTTVNSDENTFLIRRTDLPSYIAAMDNVRARLWGDYNARINGKQYAISVKSDNAGMDINQFIQLANLIINFWTYHGKGKIKTQEDLDKFKNGLIKEIKQMQTKDIVDSQAQKKIEQLGIGYSYSRKGRGHSLETMLEIYTNKIDEKINQLI